MHSKPVGLLDCELLPANCRGAACSSVQSFCSIQDQKVCEVFGGCELAERQDRRESAAEGGNFMNSGLAGGASCISFLWFWNTYRLRYVCVHGVYAVALGEETLCICLINDWNQKKKTVNISWFGLNNEVIFFPSSLTDSSMEVLLHCVSGVIGICISLFASVTALINILLVTYSFFYKINSLLLRMYLWQLSPYKRKSLQCSNQLNVPTNRNAFC